MPLRIGFFQYELSHPQNAPHVGMCLLLADLRAAGRPVDAALVHAGAVGALIDAIRAGAYDLVALDSIFTSSIVARIKNECPGVRVLVGGANALSLFLFSAADLAIVGPARRALPALLDALERGTALEEVPNLYFRDDRGVIERSRTQLPWSLDHELEPYDPDLDWAYLGPDRDPAANTRFASVVPELGCAFQADALREKPYAAIDRRGHGQTLASLPLSEGSREGVDELLENTRGCAFCTFRFQTPTRDAAARTAERVVEQIARLSARYGITEFSVQSETPFRFLASLGPLLERAEPRVETLLVRTFPAMLARNPRPVYEGIEACLAAGTRIQLQQLGFENFSAPELEHLGKGLTVEENVAAARLLYDLGRRFGNAVEVFRGHGFILFTPWTTPEDLAENLRVIETEAPFLAGSISIGSRLVFYDPFNPIFRLAEAEGLVVRTKQDYTLAFRFADPRTDTLCRLAIALEHAFLQRGAPPSRTLSRAILAGVVPLFLAPRAVDGAALFERAEGAVRLALAEDDVRWRAPHRARLTA